MTNYKRIFFGVGLLILIVIGIVLTQTNVPKEDIKIGFVGPLTGEASVIGISNKAAVQFAADEINTEGGVDGRKLELIIEDGKCDPKEATTSGKKLIEVNRVKYIIGGICSGETLAIAPIAETSKVILFSPGSSNPSITAAGDYIFRDYPSDSYQGQFAAGYLYYTLNAKKVAVIASQLDYTQGVKKVFEDEFKRLGGTIAYSTDMDPETKDFATVLTKVKEARPDVVYAPVLVAQGVRLMKAAKQQGIDAPFFGVESWNDLQTLLAEPEATEGNYYSALLLPASPDSLKAGVKQFCSTCDIAPGVLQSYDAVQILARALEKGNFEVEKVKDALYRTSYDGVSGHIEFDQNGDLKRAEYVVKKVENGAVRTVSGK